MNRSIAKLYYCKFQIIALIFIFFLTPIFLEGQDGVLSKYNRFEKETIFINKIDNNGKVFCEELIEDRATLKKTAYVGNFHLLTSLNDQRTLRGLKIILRATDQLMQNPDAILAFRRAAARWERVITTPITTVLDVDYGTTRFGAPYNPGVLGSTSTTAYYALLDPSTNALVPDFVQRFKDLKPSDFQLQDLYNAIPIPTPSTIPGNLMRGIGTLINLQALGFIDAEINADPNVNPFGDVPAIGFNSGFTFDLDPSNGITAGQYDFDAICTHEIGHALGFVTAAGFADHAGIEDLYYPWDLFRVRPEAVEPGSLSGFSSAPRVTTAGPPNTVLWTNEGGTNYFYSTHVFFDGLAEIELSTATGGRLNGDGQQSSHWRDDALRPPSLGANRWIGIMDPTLASGTRLEINNQDLRMLEVIGYGIDYNFKYAAIRVMSGADILDLDNRKDTLKFGNLDLNAQKSIQLEITNLSLDNQLIYEFEFILDYYQPSDAAVTFEGNAGSVEVGQTGTATITASNANKAAVFFGTLRIHTNDSNKLVVDIPFELNVDGALPPKISTSSYHLGDFSFAASEDLGPKTKTLSLTNLGNIPLNFRVVTVLSAKTNIPQGLSKSPNGSSNLLKFFGNRALDATVIYSNDFETDFGGFTQISDAPHGWQRTAIGPASLDGHSKPIAVHFGKEVNGLSIYDSLVTGTFYSPKFDFSMISPQDVVTISFNYYNKSEVGFDFVYFLISLDNGKTWKELASSNKGIIKEQSTDWETIVLQYPDLSGNPDSVQFSFFFDSDQLIVDQGFFIDDFEIATLPGLNSIYTSVRAGELPTLNSTQSIDVTVNGLLFTPGFYTGGISILSNDFVTPNLTIPFSISYVLLNKAMEGTLYASTGRGAGSAGRVLKLDKLTGQGIELGSSGFSPLRSISLNPVTKELFAYNYIIGSPTYIVKVDGENGFGLFHLNSAITLSALTFDQIGNLIGAASNQRFYKIDLTSGDTTFLFTSKIKVASIAIEPQTGELWGSIDASSNKDRLYKINFTTGDTSFVGNAGIGNNTIRALAFDSHGGLWGSQGEENSLSTLLKIDKNTGAAAVVGSTNYRGVLGLAFAPDSLTSLPDEQMKPTVFSLKNNYPNPFNPSTAIEFNLPVTAQIKIRIYNMLGQLIETIYSGTKQAGVHKLYWNSSGASGNSVSSGIYFYELSAKGIDGREFSQMKKMILMK
jgi:hypothetical protein